MEDRTTLVRAQLMAWGRRYRWTAVAVVAMVGIVTVFPSVVDSVDHMAPAPSPTPAMASPAAEETVVPDPAQPPPEMATPVEPSGTTTPPSSTPPTTAPRSRTPTIEPPPQRPEPVTTPCPLDLPRSDAGTRPLPLADVLNLAAPVLPLLGPFVPFVLAGTPAVESVLPVASPLLPVAEPVYVHLGPLVGDLTAPIVEFEAILIEPVDAVMADYTEDMLAAERQFIDQLRPLLDRVDASGLPDCGAIVTAALGGVLLDLSMAFRLPELLDRLLGGLELGPLLGGG